MDPAQHVAIAIDLHRRSYPDVSATALLHLRQVERMRRNPGFEGARHWGHGPHHEELQRLGLAVIGERQAWGGPRPVDMTDDGRVVADMLEGIRRGELQPITCRVCGQLADRCCADACLHCKHMDKPTIIKQHLADDGDLWGKCEDGYAWKEGGAVWNPVEWEDVPESVYKALEGPTGTYPPGECQCGETEAEICCTFASYPDGSSDEPTCTQCCRRPHARHYRLSGDLVDAKLD